MAFEGTKDISGARDCLSLAYVSQPATNINKIINNTGLPLGGEAQQQQLPV